MFFAFLLAVIALYVLVSSYSEKKLLSGIQYHVSLSHREVFVGDFLYLYEILSNNGSLSLPYAKVDTELPNGLAFVLGEEENLERQEGYVRSVFSLESGHKVERRWRLVAKIRGEYSLGNVLLIADNVFGMSTGSKRFTASPSSENTILILPATLDLDATFCSSFRMPGQTALPHGIFADPLSRIGSREYSTSDPMNRINWKVSAIQNRLMTHIEEFSRSNASNIILNMQSRSVEKNREEGASIPDYVEGNITVVASIWDRISDLNIPSALIANGRVKEPEISQENDLGVPGLLFSKAFCGRGDIMDALRLLARLDVAITLPFEKLLDAIAQNLSFFAPDGNLILVTAYLDDRILDFCRYVISCGVEISVYLTASSAGLPSGIPDQLEIFTVYPSSQSV